MTADTENVMPPDTETLSEGLPGDRDTVPPKDEKETLMGRMRKKRSDAGKPRGPRGSGTGKRGPTKARVSSLAGKLASGVNLVAAGLVGVDPYSAAVIGGNADKLANAWAPVIASNPRMVQFINQLERGGNVGAALLVTGSVALPILVHHRPEWFPEQLRAVGRAMGPQPSGDMGSRAVS